MITLLLDWYEYNHRFIVLHRAHSRLLMSIQRYFSMVINYHTPHRFLYR